jgi:hypothetical protein
MTVTVRRYAEFRADFPDDHIWNDDETDVVQTGGKAVAEAIADILKGFGCTIHEMEDNVGHCWECYFSYEGLGLWFHVVGLDDYIFELQEPPRARPDYALHLHVLLKLNEQMRRDGRFHELRWYEDGRPGREAFDVPVAGDVPSVDEIKPWAVPGVDGIKTKRSFLDKLLAPLKTRPEVR